MAEIKYTDDHECIKIEGDVAWVGITKYAQEALGDLVYVELPEVGREVKKGEDFAVVESVKTAAEVYSPVDGEVVEANDNMADDMELITQPVSEQGWIAKIKLSSPGQVDALMDYAAYQQQCEEEAN